MQPDTIADRLYALADVVARLDVARDWVDDPDEILTVVEAAALADVRGETIRRWCSEDRIGRLFAGSLWLISRRRLFAFIEKRYGQSAMLQALYRGQKMQRSLSAPQDSPPDPCSCHALKLALAACAA